MSTRIALLGGAFDPPHLDHLHMAKAVLAYGLCDEVWFSPCPDIRWDKQTHAPADDRIQMCELLIAGKERLKVSRDEIEFGTFVGAYEYLLKMQAKYPQHHFSWIMGSDSWESIPYWRNPHCPDQKYNGLDLLRDFEIILVSRNHSPPPNPQEIIIRQCKSVKFLGDEKAPITIGSWSSTWLRENLYHEKAQQVTKPAVLTYARDSGFY